MLEIKPDLQEAQPVCSTTESSLQPPPEALTHSEQYPTISLLRVHKECLRVSSPQLLKLCMETHEIVYLAGKKNGYSKKSQKVLQPKINSKFNVHVHPHCHCIPTHTSTLCFMCLRDYQQMLPARSQLRFKMTA